MPLEVTVNAFGDKEWRCRKSNPGPNMFRVQIVTCVVCLSLSQGLPTNESPWAYLSTFVLGRFARKLPEFVRVIMPSQLPRLLTESTSLKRLLAEELRQPSGRVQLRFWQLMRKSFLTRRTSKAEHALQTSSHLSKPCHPLFVFEPNSW